jgi:N-acyl homoserine lactone hydrolase
VHRSLIEALASIGMSLDDIAVVADCYLHFDHCGGNRRDR